MANFIYNGKSYVVPQAVSKVKIIQDAGGALADFSIPLLIGRQLQGHGYDQTIIDPLTGFNRGNEVDSFYGGNSDMADSFGYFKSHGGTFCYLLGLSPTTQTTATVLDKAAADSLDLTSKIYGSPSGDAMLTIANGVTYRISDATTGFRLTITGGANVLVATDIFLSPGDNISTADMATDLAAKINAAIGAGTVTVALVAGFWAIDTIDGTALVVAAPSTGTDYTEELFGGTAFTFATNIATSDNSPHPSVIFTVTPPKLTTLLLLDSGTDFVIEVSGPASGLDEYVVDDTVYLTDDDNARETHVISGLSYDTVLKRWNITFKEVISTTMLISKSARIYKEDSSNEEVSGEIRDINSCVTYFTDNSLFVGATIASGGTLIPDALAKVELKEIAGATAGTTPAPSAADWTSIAAMLAPHIASNTIRLISPVSFAGDNKVSQHANHITMRDFAVTQRSNNKPVQIIVGGLLGDIDLTKVLATDYDNPTKRSFALNEEDVLLTVGGLDGFGAYKSHAPALMGLMASNPVAHNLTRDTILASTLEKEWDEDGADIKALIEAGCIAILKKSDGLKIAKGVNTLQANAQSWNNDSTTYLPMQRAEVDFIDITLRADFDQLFIGGDGVTADRLRNRAIKTFEAIELIEPAILQLDSWKIESILPSQGQGWEFKWSASVVTETNFIAISSGILVTN